MRTYTCSSGGITLLSWKARDVFPCCAPPPVANPTGVELGRTHLCITLLRACRPMRCLPAAVSHNQVTLLSVMAGTGRRRLPLGFGDGLGRWSRVLFARIMGERALLGVATVVRKEHTRNFCLFSWRHFCSFAYGIRAGSEIAPLLALGLRLGWRPSWWLTRRGRRRGRGALCCRLLLFLPGLLGSVSSWFRLDWQEHHPFGML